MELQMWKEILCPYDLAVDELILKFTHMREEYRKAGKYSPIEQIDGRVKSISSILDKMQRKKININEVETELEDIAGIRITCQFVEDIERVVAIIKDRSDMEVKSIKDYVTTAKDSGYRSYHMIIYYTVHTIYGEQKIQAEIQVRTLAMNFWATVEHSLQYKYKENIPEHISDKLMNAADALVVLDNEMSAVRDEIMDAQNSFRKKANLVSEILTTMQNLYKVANKHEVIKIQDEFYKIYQQGNLEQLMHFNKQLDIIAEGYRAQSLS
ncbi:MAG: GTP pyrophosphokinase family protein [Anaerostipes sp.]|jgi:putative GTP pyrophosphokinase|nr:GTP pyrophosphokinase family protein [Anaerostipes sp.]MDD3745282.1 GTP pyrophosphokinase family protein [Anaerostipes sp.]MDD4369498.1 GTP pyrophosphokinase family protein [Anaerostipes sp.]